MTIDKSFLDSFARSTEKGAYGASLFKGKNDKVAADQAAVDHMRNELNIPDNAVVFGGYGAEENFDIKFVQEIVYKVARENKDIYFLFANFRRFCNPIENIIHLPMITDAEDKVKFINTTDAMLWARSTGETFGQAIAEFSYNNKPVIASKCGDLCHVHLLGEKGIWYNDNTLHDILVTFNPRVESAKDWNAFREYTPDKVMNTFNDVFLNPTTKNNVSIDWGNLNINELSKCTFSLA